ncbi:MAG: hypothetical protein AAFX02_00260 [Pseudomonadota bacterium]
MTDKSGEQAKDDTSDTFLGSITEELIAQGSSAVVDAAIDLVGNAISTGAKLADDAAKATGEIAEAAGEGLSDINIDL